MDTKKRNTPQSKGSVKLKREIRKEIISLSSDNEDNPIGASEATKITRDFIRQNICTNFMMHTFILEYVSKLKNGSWKVICSIIPDLDSERAYYILNIDDSGNLIPPICKAKKISIGKYEAEIFEIQMKSKT